MKKNINKFLVQTFGWYESNLSKIILIIGAHFSISYIVNQPYINIVTSLFFFLPYVVDWILILILFNPKKIYLLKIGFILFFVSIFFALLKLDFVLEVFGQIIYLLIGTFVIMLIYEK